MTKNLRQHHVLKISHTNSDSFKHVGEQCDGSMGSQTSQRERLSKLGLSADGRDPRGGECVCANLGFRLRRSRAIGNCQGSESGYPIEAIERRTPAQAAHCVSVVTRSHSLVHLEAHTLE